MTVNYDIEKINRVLRDFYNATGINMDLLGVDFKKLSSRRWEDHRYCSCVQSTQAGKTACCRSDEALLARCARSKQTERQLCHAGLVDVAVPILYEQEILGYLIFGQLRTDRETAVPTDHLARLGLPLAEMLEHYRAVPLAEGESLESISRLAGMLVRHILLEKMLAPQRDEGLQRAEGYIRNNLDKDLSVRTLSRGLNLSKSVLYKRFHAGFGCTVSEYINARRVERAAELLQKSDASLEEIARLVGFSGGSYFSKVFKRQMGLSPLKYRQSAK